MISPLLFWEEVDEFIKCIGPHYVGALDERPLELQLADSEYASKDE